MSHAMLAKDSMLDLEALARESDPSSASSPKTKDSSRKNGSHAHENLDADPSQTDDPANSIAETSSSSIGTFTQRPPQHADPSPYSGFTAGYDPAYDNDDGSDSHYHFHDSYATLYLGEKQHQNNFWCCLFPWMTQGGGSKSSAPFQTESYEAIVNEPPSAVAPSRDSDADEVASNSSELLGERLSEKERQAVLARLGLAAPDAPPETDGSDESVQDKRGLLNGISSGSIDDTSCDSNSNGSGGRKKGILRRKSTVTSTKEKDAGSRRSLFPVYETKTRKQNLNNVSFQPMARVLTVKSKNDMTPTEKSDIWWQKSDYEDFRKTGRIITRAMLEGGSEIWLALNESWRAAPDASRSATLKTAVSMSEADTKGSPQTNAANDMSSATGDKWWHAFGHSRRGLEHVVSMEEGRQRQANVRRAIKAVMEEQARQKLYHREDPDKLRMVSLNHTSWARDLAFASGASDADAVKSSFAEDRKSREFFLLKLARNKKTSASQAIQSVPQFMQPAIKSASRLSATQRLDANTAAQIRYRRKVVDEPIRDGIHDKTLARRAAGFSATQNKVNMAAVLTGMGTVAS